MNTIVNNDPVNIVTTYTPGSDLKSPKGRSVEAVHSPELTPKVRKMNRNISSKGVKRNLTIDSIKSNKDQSPLK